MLDKHVAEHAFVAATLAHAREPQGPLYLVVRGRAAAHFAGRCNTLHVTYSTEPKAVFNNEHIAPVTKLMSCTVCCWQCQMSHAGSRSYKFPLRVQCGCYEHPAVGCYSHPLSHKLDPHGEPPHIYQILLLCPCAPPCHTCRRQVMTCVCLFAEELV